MSVSAVRCVCACLWVYSVSCVHACLHVCTSAVRCVVRVCVCLRVSSSEIVRVHVCVCSVRCVHACLRVSAVRCVRACVCLADCALTPCPLAPGVLGSLAWPRVSLCPWPSPSLPAQMA